MKIQITKQEILTALNLPLISEIELINDEISQSVVFDKTITITFPEMTAEAIVTECKNKVAKGALLYGEWYKKEAFYTTEKTRPGTRVISTELLHAGKSWNEITAMDTESSMLNFAEVVYLLRESAGFRDMFRYGNEKNAWWTWTNSRDSGGNLVAVGGFDDDGANVLRNSPDDRSGLLGVSFSRNA